MPDLETLNGSLNGEPAGTAAHALELAAISELLQLAERVGYGRVARLACGMREIWLCPGRARQFAARRRQAMLAEAGAGDRFPAEGRVASGRSAGR